MSSVKLQIMMAFLLTYCICQINGQFYSQRTKCSANRLSIDSQIANFYQNTQFSGVNITQVIDVMGMVKRLFHHGKKVQQTKISNHRCQNYFLSSQICCRYSDLDQFTDKMADLYKRTYYKSKHPMVDYIYKIYDIYKTLNSYCLGNYNLLIPERHNTTKDNATQPLGDLFSKINDQMSLIKQFQLDYIYNSACMLCMGIQDFKTFIHPTHQDVRKTKRLIYNQQYWTNVTSFIATRMLNSKNYADQIQNFINNQLKPKINTAAQCSTLAAMINNQTQITKRKVCDTYDECIKFAQKYIGAPTAPAYSKMFTSVQQKRGITKNNYRLITQTEYGFKGNQTYQRYLRTKVPPVQIRGNDYTYA